MGDLTNSTQNGFPRLDSPFVNDSGLINIPWYRMLIALWNRTGGASGSLSEALDNISKTQGSLLYRGSATWTGLAPGASGQALITGGPGNNPAWGNVVTSVATTGGITGGPITSTGSISIAPNGVDNTKLAQMPSGTLKGNNTGSAASPSDLSVADVQTLLGIIASGSAAGGDLFGTYPNPSVSANLSFLAYLSSNQSVTASTATKVNFDSVAFNLGSGYSTSTFRFTPTKKGVYLLSSTLYTAVGSGTLGGANHCYFYKNGSPYFVYVSRASGVADASVSASAMVQMNGTTDYVEVYTYVTGTSPYCYGTTGPYSSIFQGHYVGGY